MVTGEQQQYPYDTLVLAPGVAAIKPPLPGVDLPNIFQMKTVPDRCGWGAAATPLTTTRMQRLLLRSFRPVPTALAAG